MKTPTRRLSKACSIKICWLPSFFCQISRHLTYFRNGYHIGTGKWSSMMLKRPKKPGGAAKRKKLVPDRIKESLDEKKEQTEQNDSEVCFLIP